MMTAFGQKLHTDGGTVGTDGFRYADLPRTFGNRHEHDIIRPMAAPNKVINPMTLAAMVTYFKLSIRVVAISSFLLTEKLFSCMASSRLAFRIEPFSFVGGYVMALISLTHTLMT
ncbi:hypothetical protein EMGBS15_17350 [Filimonas sp.]|nr:hypothetical protein EMGBS15_17350 [Filimonas sp.]